MYKLAEIVPAKIPLAATEIAGGKRVDALPRSGGYGARFWQNGETSEGALKSMGEVIDAHPDIVLIEFSANDAAWFKGFSLKRSRENTGRIVQTILGALPETKIFLMTMSPAFGPRRWIRLNLDAYYSLYESLASELGIGYIDNRPRLERFEGK